MFTHTTCISQRTPVRFAGYFLMMILCWQSSIVGMESVSRKRERVDDVDCQVNEAEVRFEKLVQNTELMGGLVNWLRGVVAGDYRLRAILRRDNRMSLVEYLSRAVDGRNDNTIKELLVEMLFIACIHDESFLVRELITAGVPVDAFYSGCVPLYWATVNGNNEVCKTLIELKAQVNIGQVNTSYNPILGEMVFEDSGYTPFHCAVKYCSAEVVSKLLAAGADVNATARDGKTPLHMLVERIGHLRLYLKGGNISIQWMKKDNLAGWRAREASIAQKKEQINGERYFAEQAALKNLLENEIALRVEMLEGLSRRHADTCRYE